MGSAGAEHDDEQPRSWREARRLAREISRILREVPDLRVSYLVSRAEHLSRAQGARVFNEARDSKASPFD
jgi:hypothetical protein